MMYLHKNKNRTNKQTMGEVEIREIRPDDNREVARLIRRVLEEMGVPKVGTAYADKALEDMYTEYDVPGATYFVVEEKGQIIGGSGIAKLQDFQGPVCELQKMYFLDRARGRGIGSKMIGICMDRAREYGFEQCYLETMPDMESAQILYKRNGFEPITAPMGNTGHFSCPVWMLKQL